MTVEYWVMRVIVSKDQPDREARLADYMADRGVVACLADGSLAWVGDELCAPVECYSSDELPVDNSVGRRTMEGHARAKAIQLHRRTGNVHKVVMSADLETSKIPSKIA